jgi:DNA-binding NarL/FixJ family response regulator
VTSRKRIPARIVPDALRVVRGNIGELEVIVCSYKVTEPKLPPGLSSAEQAVALAILEGKSNQAIADERGSAVRTVANQVASLFAKCGVSSRAELVALLSASSE